LAPLYGLSDTRKPLRSKLLAVPALRARYLAYVREMAEKSLDWKNLEPLVKQYVTLIEKEAELDTRKLSSTAAFKTNVYKTDAPGGRGMALQTFIEQRQAYLLNHPDLKRKD